MPKMGQNAGVTTHAELTDVSTPHVLADLESAVASETEVAVEIAIEAIARDAAIATHAALFGLHSKAVLKTVDESVINSTTLQNDDALVLAVGANEIWEIILYMRYTRDSGGSKDTKFGWSLPSGAQLVLRGSWGGSGAESDGTSAVTVTGAVTVGGLHYKYLYIGGSIAGNAQFQWAQNTSESYNHTIKANSHIIARKLA